MQESCGWIQFGAGNPFVVSLEGPKGKQRVWGRPPKFEMPYALSGILPYMVQLFVANKMTPGVAL